ncbi:MAG: hypothetical protein AAF125_02745 [Chloroflexota bacterium]
MRPSVSIYTCLALLLTIVSPAVVPAQDALNLPTELYVLLNSGQVQRYGTGAEGVQPATPDGQFVIDFGVAPGGGWIAYRTDNALVVGEVLNPGEGAAIEVNPPPPPSRGDGATIAWSPDAKALAYTTTNGFRVRFRIVEPPLEPTTTEVTDGFDGGGFSALRWSPDGRYIAARSIVDDIWQVYSTQRTVVELVAIIPPATDVTWLSGGRLAFAPQDGGLVQLNADVGNAQADLVTGADVYDRLAVREDGTLAAFERVAGTETGRLVTIDPVAGTVATLGEADVELDGLRWTPALASMAAYRGGVLALVNPMNGAGFPLPINNVVAYDWGRSPLPTVNGYPVPINLFFVAADDTGVDQVWQLFRDGSSPVPLTRSAENVTGYTLSPDGFTVAYSAGSQLWTQRLNDNSDPQPVAGRQTDASPTLDFSADGTTLAYTDLGGLWTAPVLGGEPTLLLADNIPDEDTPAADARQFTAPRYAPNFGALLLDILYAEGGATGVLDLNSGELLELPYGYSNAVWTYNGGIFTHARRSPFTQAGAQVTFITDLDAPEVRLPTDVSVEHAVLIPRRRSEDIRLIIDAETTAGPTPLRVFDFRDGGGLVPVVESGFAEHPRLSPDGTVVAGYVRAGNSPTGPHGQLSLLDVATGEQVALAAPGDVTLVEWQR